MQRKKQLLAAAIKQAERLDNAINNVPKPPRRTGRRRRNATQQLVTSNGNQPQIGAVVQTRLSRLGMSDITRHRIAWVAGYTYVGDGTNGAANSVLFEDATSTHLLLGYSAGISSGLCPILAADPNVGQAYIQDIEKHYARKRINRMWLRIESLQPSTSNNMMVVVAPRRGCPAVGGLNTGGVGDWRVLATAGATGNTVANVSSMKGAMSVDSWETKSLDITDFIAGGTGPKQNEFELGSLATSNATLVSQFQDLLGVAPACFAIAGNSTTAGLQGTKVHQVVIEQECDYLDYIGGLAQENPEE
jgi:hypothetical protein